MKRSSKRWLAFVIVGAALSIAFYQSLKSDADTRKITSNAGHGVAQVIKTETNPKSKHVEIRYAFAKSNTTYIGNSEMGKMSVSGEELIDHYFPVIYSEEDPGLSHLLITGEDFKRFDMEQPDSLKKYNTAKD